MTTCVVLLALVFAAVIVLATFGHLAQEREKEFKSRCNLFRSDLLKEIKKCGLAEADFAALVQRTDVKPAVATRVAEDLYADCFTKAVADGVISSGEQRQLKALKLLLPLSERITQEIEGRVKSDRFKKAARGSLDSGQITDEVSSELARLRTQLKMNDGEIAQAVAGDVLTGYITLFRECAADGIITPEEMHHLQKYRDAFAFDLQAANAAIRSDAMALYRRWHSNVVNDGEVSDEEEWNLAWLRDEFGLNSPTIAGYEAETREIKRLAAYRRGDLPTIKTNKILEGGEFCHWEGQCVYQWQTATKTKDASGLLIVTSGQIVFASPQRSFSFSPSKIIDVDVSGHNVIVRTSSNRGSGEYGVGNTADLEAILVGLVPQAQVSGRCQAISHAQPPHSGRRSPRGLASRRRQVRAVRCRGLPRVRPRHPTRKGRREHSWQHPVALPAVQQRKE